LSPNNKWERNKIDTITVIEAYFNNLSPVDVKVCTYNQNKNKAFDILYGVKSITENSPKTHAFSMNVGLLSPSHITIDKWHIRACLSRPTDKSNTALQESISERQYRRIERITAKLASDHNLKGYEIQAIIWLAIRNAWKNNK